MCYKFSMSGSFVGICAALLVFAFQSDAPRAPGKLIDAGGYRVHLYCTGAGRPPVIVVGGAFSFDWGLVQPGVAAFTQICTYDVSGTAWSDSYPGTERQQKSTPSCVDRIVEIHNVLKNAAVSGPYVLVGFSIGGLLERLYTSEYPMEVAGLVIVDHALIDIGRSDAAAAAPPRGADRPPVLISAPPIKLGIEDDQNFKNLPQRDQDLHAWAMSTNPLRPTAEMAAECSTSVESRTGTQNYPLGNRPLIVIRTNNNLPAYQSLQAKLMRLSRDSKQMLAARSSHLVIIDEPGMVIDSIHEVVEAVRRSIH